VKEAAFAHAANIIYKGRHNFQKKQTFATAIPLSPQKISSKSNRFPALCKLHLPTTSQKLLPSTIKNDCARFWKWPQWFFKTTALVFRSLHQNHFISPYSAKIATTNPPKSNPILTVTYSYSPG